MSYMNDNSMKDQAINEYNLQEELYYKLESIERCTKLHHYATAKALISECDIIVEELISFNVLR